MAKSKRNEQFGTGAVYGSLAYDFNNPNLYTDIPAEMPEQAPAAPKTGARKKNAVRAVAANKQALAPGAILGYACAAILLVFTLLARVQLVGISEESVALSEQLSQLELDQSRLLIEYESAFNLTEIEDYAISELGMQKPTGDQIYYVDGSAPDKAVIVEDSKNADGLQERLNALLDTLGEYFR